MINVHVQLANLIIGNWTLFIGYITAGGVPISLMVIRRSMFDVHLFPLRSGWNRES
jgi:hypothetical protein